MERKILITAPSEDYELIDSGEEEKLERYGAYVLARPDPQALWPKRQPEVWGSAHAHFVREGGEGKWIVEQNVPKEWEIGLGGLRMIVKPTSFKHTGVFPEQEPNWSWVREVIASANGPVKVLNLFGYTGGATLAAAQAGAEVVHVDASKTAVAWARENAASSGLGDKPVRWIVEDVLVFIKREIKRGSRYDLIVMDPPAFGHGPHDELWKIEENLLELMRLCKELLSEKPLGIAMSGYAAGYSPLAFAYNLGPFVEAYGGQIEYGDLSIAEKGSDRTLPCGIFARWRV